MRRLLHILAIAALIGSALYAYRIKYDTLYLSEQVAKLKTRIAREKEAIAVLRAEWQFVNRPDRVQMLADKHLPDLAPAAVTQAVRWSEIPPRPAQADAIGAKLEALGLAAPTNTPTSSKAPDGRPLITGTTTPGRKP
ncbi:cell division protein FtsL [Alsobacter sp. R-9]